MPKVRRTTVTFAYRRGFKHSYSSAEIVISEELTLAEGEDCRTVRQKALARLQREVVSELRAFRRKHDKIED